MRLIKRIFIVILIIPLLLFAGIVTLYFTVKPQQIIKLLSSSLESKFGISVSAESATISLLKGLETTQLVIRDTALSNNILISCSNGSILYNPASFMQGALDIQRLELSGTAASWDDLTTLRARFQNKTADQAKKSKFIIHEITVHDFQLKVDHKIYQLNGSISLGKDFVPEKISARIKAGEADLQYSGNLATGDVRIKSLLLSDLFPKSPPLLFQDLEGKIGISDKSYISLSINRFKMGWNTFSLMNQAPFKAAYNLSNRVLNIDKTQLTVNNSSVSLNNFILDLKSNLINLSATDSRIVLGDLLKDAGGSMTGGFNLVYDKTIKLTGELLVTNASYLLFKEIQGSINLRDNALKAMFSLHFADHLINGTLNSENFFGPAYSADLYTETLDLNKLLPVLQEFIKTIGANKAPEAKPLFRKIQYHLTTDSFRLFGFTVEKLDVRGKFENRDLFFDSVTGLWSGGELKYSGMISKGELSGMVAVEEGKLKTLSENYIKGEKKIYGTFGIQANIRVPLFRPADCLVSFKGSIQKGELKDFFLQSEISQYLNDVPINDIFFDTIDLEGKLSGGNLSFENIQYNSPDIQASIKGSYGILDQAFNLKALLYFTKTYLADLPNVAQLYTSGYEEGEKVLFPLSIKGTLSKPSIEMRKNNQE